MQEFQKRTDLLEKGIYLAQSCIVYQYQASEYMLTIPLNTRGGELVKGDFQYLDMLKVIVFRTTWA